MKKLLIATAAMAMVAGTAQAQSSVTVYGVVDNGITSASKVGTASSNGTVTGLSNGGLSTPRIGFKGKEDLGGGLSANFLLETEILSDVGASGGNELFTRGSWVGLDQKNIGSLRMGRINRIDNDMAAKFDAFGGSNIGGWIALKDSNANATGAGNASVGLKVGEKISNALELKSASLGGLVLTAQTGFGEQAGDTEKNRTFAIGADFKAGNFNVAAAYSEKNTVLVATKQTSLYANYNFGVATLTGGHVSMETEGTTAEPSGYFVGVKVPVTKATNVMAQYASLDNDAGVKPKVYTLGMTYDFSKRTTGYIIGAMNNGTGQTIVSSSKYANFQKNAGGQDASVYSVGIRHKF
uniref:porin n=1 Tax=Polynucleobacter sp. TaxID=2029855 RepID=UPI0040488296